MKHLKPMDNWLVENSNLEELVRLGIVDPNSLTRILFRSSRDSIGIIWQEIKDGKTHRLVSMIERLTIGYWSVLEPGETLHDPTDPRPRLRGSMEIPENLLLEDIVDRAERLTRDEFVKFIDEACCEWLKTAVEKKGAFDSSGVQMIVSNLTGQTLSVNSPARLRAE
jgi:hypothetical protein